MRYLSQRVLHARPPRRRPVDRHRHRRAGPPGNGQRAGVSAHQGLSASEIKAQGMDAYFVDHTTGVWPQAASGAPFTSMCFASKRATPSPTSARTWRPSKGPHHLRQHHPPGRRPGRIAGHPLCANAKSCITSALARALELIKSDLDFRNFRRRQPEFDPSPKS